MWIAGIAGIAGDNGSIIGVAFRKNMPLTKTLPLCSTHWRVHDLRIYIVYLLEIMRPRGKKSMKITSTVSSGVSSMSSTPLDDIVLIAGSFGGKPHDLGKLHMLIFEKVPGSEVAPARSSCRTLYNFSCRTRRICRLQVCKNCQLPIDGIGWMGCFLTCFARHPICLNSPLEQLLFHTSATTIFVKNGEIEKSAASIPKKKVERKPLAISRTVCLIDLLEVLVISWLNVTLTAGRGLGKNRQVEIEHRNDWQLK